MVASNYEAAVEFAIKASEFWLKCEKSSQVLSIQINNNCD
jgi:hypothetical protein